MSNAPTDLSTRELTSDERLAAALDEIIDARHAGRPIDRGDLAARYPQLAGALDALAELTGPPAPEPANAPRPLCPRPPDQVGPYRLERELGAGGFGTVYLAYDCDLKRPVALKLLHPARLAQPGVLERFQREACATAQLRHPDIVALLDHSRQGPPHYLVTEFVDGLDLQAWSRQHQPGLEESARLVARLAEAIDYAHGQGVYHRDLKPGNILLDAQGNPHILDFGLARLGRDLGNSPAAPTSDGKVLGTLAYMAPEQAAGHSHRADARSDVYSLGVILYELLTGRLPFTGDTEAVWSRVLHDEPPRPLALRPDLPRDLEAICLKALAKHPEQRYNSAAALARDLRAFLRGERIEARPLTWIVRVHRVLNRQHQVVRLEHWSTMLFLQGLLILAGCGLVNLWQLLLGPGQRLGPILATKAVQVAAMLYLVFRFRPLAERDLTAGERQIWALVPAYYGAFLAVLGVNCFLDQPLPLAPCLAILSGMAFVTLGASIWGWLYVWGAAFFGLAILMAATRSSYAMLLLGLGWFVCLAVGSIQLRLRSR